MLLERLREISATLPDQQKKAALYVVENYKQAAFLTSTELALKATVSGTTINRLCITLGYKGYSDFQAVLQALIQNELTAVDRSNAADEHGTVLSQVFRQEIFSLKRALDAIDEKTFEEAADLIFKSRRLEVVGHQACEPIARYAAYTLAKVRNYTEYLDLGSLDVAGHLSDLGKDDVALAFGLPRYPVHTTNTIKLLHEKGVKIILVTHSRLCPYTSLSDLVITTPIAYHNFTDGLSPLICIVNALVLEVFNRDKKKGKKQLNEFETVGSFLFETMSGKI